MFPRRCLPICSMTPMPRGQYDIFWASCRSKPSASARSCVVNVLSNEVGSSPSDAEAAYVAGTRSNSSVAVSGGRSAGDRPGPEAVAVDHQPRVGAQRRRERRISRRRCAADVRASAPGAVADPQDGRTRDQPGRPCRPGAGVVPAADRGPPAATAARRLRPPRLAADDLRLDRAARRACLLEVEVAASRQTPLSSEKRLSRA